MKKYVTIATLMLILGLGNILRAPKVQEYETDAFFRVRNNTSVSVEIRRGDRCGVEVSAPDLCF